MSCEMAIQAKGLGKAYKIFQKPEDRLKQMLWRGRRHFYKEFWALQDLDIQIKRGETVGVIGRNGSGKSTFLQLVCGTLTPTCGDLSVQGRVGALLELGAGFNPEFTGKENIYLAGSILGLGSDQIDERFESILEFAGIGDFINQPVKFFSSGMYARLAFAVVAHVDADILIIDEILAVGDAAFTQKCMRYLHRFKELGTLLFVSHDSGSVTHLCDRVIWLESGAVREIGSAKEVCHNYMAAIHSEKDNTNSFKIGGSRKPPPHASLPVKDVSGDIVKDSPLRNEIHIFDFDPNAPWFGQRGASIQEVLLLSPNGSPLTVLNGGEEVILKVSCLADQVIEKPIVGFYMKDRLGQELFGDNTYLTYQNNEEKVQNGQKFSTFFRFYMPFLPTGDFSICVGIAEGTQLDFVLHHWVDDVLFFKVLSSHVARGLIGVPMLSIGMEINTRNSCFGNTN